MILNKYVKWSWPEFHQRLAGKDIFKGDKTVEKWKIYHFESDAEINRVLADASSIYQVIDRPGWIPPDLLDQLDEEDN